MILPVHTQGPDVVELRLAYIAPEIGQLLGHVLIQMMVVLGSPAKHGIAVLADEDLFVVFVLQMNGNGFHVVGCRGATVGTAQGAVVIVVGFDEELFGR